MYIGEIGERELIKKISALLAHDLPEGLLVGIGDDAAVTSIAPGMCLVTTKDLLVEGIHFVRDGLTARELGYKSLAVNLSDIAAMGAKACYAYVAMAMPPNLSVEYVLDFYRGMKELADKYRVVISGGDTVGSPGPLVISVTVQGEVEKGRALLRSGALPGDVLCTTGPLGASAAGLSILLGETTEYDSEAGSQAMRSHKRPEPRIAEGIFLSGMGCVSAAIDISDGLLKDLSEICDASHCGAILEEKDIPIHPAASALASLQGKDPLELALSGGEDYEILLCINPNSWERLEAAYRIHFDGMLYRFGQVSVDEGINMNTEAGYRKKLAFQGYKHF